MAVTPVPRTTGLQPTPGRHDATRRGPQAIDRLDVLHLAELVPVVRDRFVLDAGFPDDAILASLKSIVANSQPRERWRAAFASNLGVALSRQGRDLATALTILLALLPSPSQ